MERIVKDPNKNYIGETEPFFINDEAGRIEILRPANFWSNPTASKESK